MANLTNNARNPDGSAVTPGAVIGGVAVGNSLYEIGVNILDAVGNPTPVMIGPGQTITATLATPIPPQTQALITGGRLVVA